MTSNMMRGSFIDGDNYKGIFEHMSPCNGTRTAVCPMALSCFTDCKAISPTVAQEAVPATGSTVQTLTMPTKTPQAPATIKTSADLLANENYYAVKNWKEEVVQELQQGREKAEIFTRANDTIGLVELGEENESILAIDKLVREGV